MGVVKRAFYTDVKANLKSFVYSLHVLLHFAVFCDKNVRK